MDGDKDQLTASTTPAAAPGAGASSWDLPADNISPNGLPQGKTDAPADPADPDFTYSVKNDSFSDDLTSDNMTNGDDQKSLADKMIKNLEAEEKKPYSEENPKVQSATLSNSSSGSLASLEKKISDQKNFIDNEIKKLQGEKDKLDGILDKISALKKEEDNLVSQAQDILK